MRALPREAFAPPGALAYSDADIDLGGGRYLLAPMLTARLAQLVMANNPEHVLVVAAGAGYLSAILAHCGAKVVALEEEARLDTGVHAPGVERVSGKLKSGWPAGGPFDAILIEGAVPSIPTIFAAQLLRQGRVITILAEGTVSGCLGRAVIAQAAGNHFAAAPMFDCTARILPAFRRAPEFTF
jgi:protein-L-isoaspartate(D-aspartate) O-methyltransferase